MPETRPDTCGLPGPPRAVLPPSTPRRPPPAVRPLATALWPPPSGHRPLSTSGPTRLNAGMGNRSDRPQPRPPSLASLFVSFVSIGMMSVGGGLSAWTRREVVQKKAWLDDKQFLSGYALSQLVPGATNVNLAVFIGTQMRGAAGALACFFGLVTLPVAIVLLLGEAYCRFFTHINFLDNSRNLFISAQFVL